jgi:hypothetical protein
LYQDFIRLCQLEISDYQEGVLHFFSNIFESQISLILDRFYQIIFTQNKVALILLADHFFYFIDLLLKKAGI